MKKLTIILSLVLTASLALAQGFQVISTVPAEATVNVPLNLTVSFTFSEPIDTSYHFETDDDEILPIGLLGPEPFDSAEVVSWEMSPDLTTIYFDVTHTDNTDFFWLIIGAFNGEGNPLNQPACLHYSTTGDLGPWTVSGTISIDEGEPTHAVVGLMDCSVFDQGEDGGSLYAGTFVPDASGDYVVPYVRNGVFWPIAAYDLNGDGEIDPDTGDLLGFWDPDEDSQPDSVIVADGNLTGIDMTLLDFLFEEVTVHEYLPQAWELADEWADDQELHFIASATDVINIDGTSPAWVYLFFAPGEEFFTEIMISSFFAEVDTMQDIELPTNMIPIPEDFVDSNEAMTIAYENGGMEYENDYNMEERWLHGGNIFWHYPDYPDEVAWVASYGGYDPDSGEEVTLHIAMDIVTGEIIQISWDWEDVGDPSAEQLPRNFELYQNYPNPFNPVTTISYGLSFPAEVELVVYNINGEKIATLVDSPQTAGLHNLQFDGSDLPGGIYFYRLTAGSVSLTNRMLLVK